MIHESEGKELRCANFHPRDLVRAGRGSGLGAIYF